MTSSSSANKSSPIESGQNKADEMPPAAITLRQREVLEATLALIVEASATLTMAAVARRANCSKETLYKWFGDRDGLLTATVQWQAAKVGDVGLDGQGLDLSTLQAGLRRFAHNWLAVICGPTSVALNRVAIAQGGGERRNLGTIVLENGPFAMRRRLGRMLTMGRDAALLRFEDVDDAFAAFFGLVVRDVQIRLLLGEPLMLAEADMKIAADRAVRQFFVLYGTDETASGRTAAATSAKP